MTVVVVGGSMSTSIFTIVCGMMASISSTMHIYLYAIYYIHIIITFYLIHMINALLHYVPSSSTVYAQFIINYLFALRQIIIL